MTTGNCVILADRHHALAEGVRDLLATSFASVFTVGDEASLLEGTQRLQPKVVVVDLKFAGGDLPAMIARIGRQSPATRIIVLTVHDEPTVARAAIRAGAHGVVLKRSIATDLLAAVDEVMAGREYLSPRRCT